jgi:hypothetical protein
MQTRWAEEPETGEKYRELARKLAGTKIAVHSYQSRMTMMICTAGRRPRKAYKKSRKSPKLGAGSISIPTTAADRDREAAPATGNGSDHESDWNEVEDTDGLEDGLELMSRKEAQKIALKNIKKPVSTPNASVALHADC